MPSDGEQTGTERGFVDISMAVDDLAYDLGFDEDEYEVAETEYAGGGDLIVWLRPVSGEPDE